MIQNPAVAGVDTTGEQHQTEEENDSEGPYYDAAVKAVAEQGANRKPR